MAISFIQVDTHSRAKGHSVAAALAYRAGLALRDCRTAELHDYRPRETREEIDASGIVSPRPTSVGADWQTLADAIEGAERRRDSRILRDIKIAIPHELDAKQRKDLAEDLATEIARHLDTVAAFRPAPAKQ